MCGWSATVQWKSVEPKQNWFWTGKIPLNLPDTQRPIKKRMESQYLRMALWRSPVSVATEVRKAVCMPKDIAIHMMTGIAAMPVLVVWQSRSRSRAELFMQKEVMVVLELVIMER